MAAARNIESTILQVLEKKEEELDAELSQLDRVETMKDEELEAIRGKRIEELKNKQKMQNEYLSRGHGNYDEVNDPKLFFETAKQSDKLVVHFYRSATWRCDIIHKHLSLSGHTSRVVI
eukprot:Filipodium_phascolosomae@DN996_c0_g1_i1.p1